MQELKIFEKEEFGAVRIAMVEGEPWFVASDICKALDISNTTQAVQRLDDDEKSMLNIGLSGGSTNCVNEYGLYNLILSSRKKEAKEFKRWITHEVVPSIRKNGGYIEGQEILSDDELLEKAVLVAQRKIAERDKIIKRQKEQIEEQKPLVDFATHVSQSKDTIDMEEMAKIAQGEQINIGRNRLIKWLKEKRILKDNRTPYQTFIDRGYFDVVETKKETVYGTLVFPKTVITGKGQLWVIEKLRAEYC